MTTSCRELFEVLSDNWYVLTVLNHNMDIKLAKQNFYLYTTQIKGYSKETVRRFENVISVYCKHYSVHSTEDINHENVRDLFYHGRTVRTWSTNTFHVYHKSLNVFFKWCLQNNLLKDNPIAEIEVPSIEKKLPKKLTKQSALELLEIVNNYPFVNSFLRVRNHAIFAMFVFCGLRKSELLHLQYSDVDLDNLSVFVRQGKGGKDRLVPISESLHKILKKYVQERGKKNITCPSFFASSTQNSGLTNAGLLHLYRLIKEVSKIPFTIHSLRHTFATLMLEGGCDIYSLSKMMGHNQITTTTIYLSASIDHLRSQILKHPLNQCLTLN